MALKNIISDLKKGFRHHDRPNFSDEEIATWEKSLGFPMPASFKEYIRSGTFDTGTFRLIQPYCLEKSSHLVVFARWNDNLFAFNVQDGKKSDYPVYIIVRECGEEKVYDNFLQWLNMVSESVKAPSSPE